MRPTLLLPTAHILFTIAACAPASTSETPSASAASSSSTSPVQTVEPAETPQAPKPALVAFTFRGIADSASIASVTEKLTKCVESRTEAGTTLCRLADPSLAGVPLDKNRLFFDDGGFNSIMTEFTSQRFESVRDDLISAYGEPCLRKTETVQNKFGAVYENEKLAWCFTGGMALLDKFKPEYGTSSLSLETSHFSYVASRTTAPPPPEKTPDDL